MSLEACLAALAWGEAHAERAYASMAIVNTDAAGMILRKLKQGHFSACSCRRLGRKA